MGVMDHLFVRCHFYGRIWCLVSRWLGFSTTIQGTLLDYLTQFSGLGSHSLSIQVALNTIWLYMDWVIRKERNRRIFQVKEDHLQFLCEKVKLRSLWWLTSKFVTLILIISFGGLVLFLAYLL